MSRLTPLLCALVVTTCAQACSDDPVTHAADAELLDTGGSDLGRLDVDAAADGAADGVGDVADGGDDATQDLADAADSVPLDAADAAEVAVDAADASSGPMLTIVVEGSLEDLNITDGSSGQTPDPYFYGLQRLQMLDPTGATAPATVFDHAPGQVMVDMLGRTVVARVPIADLPDGTYTQFRIVLTVLEATVNATVHDIPSVGTLATPLAITYALSNVNNDDYEMRQGDAIIASSVLGVSFERHFPVSYPEPSPGGWAESVDGRTFVTFALAEPLVVSSDVPADVAYVIRYYVHESFRWTDLRLEGYAAGEWDVSASPTGVNEAVTRFGANGFEVFAE